jgi:hypothetical protein
MKPVLVQLRGQSGYLFEGDRPRTFCFVPAECVFAQTDGFGVMELEYVHSRWDVLNMRFNDEADGQHLFPDVKRPVLDDTLEAVRNFLLRANRQ